MDKNESVAESNSLPEGVKRLLEAPRGVSSEEHPRWAAAHDSEYSWLPNNSIDFVLTDPPFNIAQDTNFHTYENNTIHSYRFDKDKGWDTYSHAEFIALLGHWSAEISRVLRKGGTFAIFCADAYVSHLIDALKQNGLKPRRVVTWRKPNAVPINRATMMMSSAEYVVVGVKGSKATFNADIDLLDLDTLKVVERTIVSDKASTVLEGLIKDKLTSITSSGPQHIEDVVAAVQLAISQSTSEISKRIRAMYVSDGDSAYLRACVPNYISQNSKAGNRIHPTEKPVPLLEYLIALMSKPDDLILDPFSGSGSMGEAALNLGRRPILVEQDKEYFKAINERLSR